MNPFEIGDHVTRKDSTYFDGTIVDLVDNSIYRVYWRKSTQTKPYVGVHSAAVLARKV